MAGQARRGTRGQGRSSRGASSWPVLAAASAAVSGSAIETRAAASSSAAVQVQTTRATYRTLLLKGMAPDEAANLTAYLAGIPVGEATWTLSQVNRLLFLREMQRIGHFGHADGTSTH
jgi:hypothetical protein